MDDLLKHYPDDVPHTIRTERLKTGEFIGAVVIEAGDEFHVWNTHPARNGRWQKVYTLTRCNAKEQAKESCKALRRLYEEL